MTETISRAPGRTAAALIVAVILGIPTAYVLLDRSTPKVAMAQATTPTATSTLAESERLAASEPTPEHRLNLSQALIDSGLYGRAIAVLNGLIAENAKFAPAWNNLCVAQTLQQQYNLALPACETGLRLNPEEQLIRNNLKWAQDQRVRALQTLSDQERTPEAQRNASFYVDEGLNQLHLGNYDQAIDAWKRSLQLDPHEARAQNNIGIAQMMQTHYREADASFRKALTLDPDNQLAKNNLAWAMEQEKISP